MNYSSFLQCICLLFAVPFLLAQEANINVSEFVFEKGPFKECHAPTLVVLEDGSIMASWFAGTHERHEDVAIYTSIKKEGSWSYPKLVANGAAANGKKYPTWNPVLFKNPNGLLYLYYKVGPSPSTWWGMYKTSKDNGETWSEAKKLSDGILGPIKNKPLLLKNGNILSPSSVELENGEIWLAHMEHSSDSGKTWQKIKIPQKKKHKLIQPTLLTLKDQSILALFRSNQDKVVYSKSKDNGITWSKAKAMDLENPNSGIDALTMKNGNHLLVYNPALSGDQWWDGRSKLNLGYSQDGMQWKPIVSLENHQKGEYSYPAIVQDQDGYIHLVYTYDRKKIKYVKLKIED